MTDPDDEKPCAPRVFLIVTYHEESGTLNIADMSTPDELKAEILDALIDVLGDDCGESEIFH